jgi:protein O-mannosyl-transferase
MNALLVRLRPHFLPALLLVILALLVYGQSVGFDFIINWDDDAYVTRNPDILGISAANLVRIFSSPYAGNYAPLHLLSYMLDYQLAGLNPAWFHGVNLALHALNGVLFYLLVRLLTGKTFWAFAASALFLLHPVQVESVAWVSERKNLLAMCFSLGSFLCYLRYRQKSGEGRLAYSFSLLFLVLALLAKSIAVVTPFFFLLYDALLDETGRKRFYLADKVPFLVATALACGVAMFTQSAAMGGGIVDYFEGHRAAKILTMLTVLASYLRILVCPSKLSLIYVFVIKRGIDAEVLLALVLLVALCGAGLYLWRRERRLFFGFALFFLGLLPVSQIVPLATLMNDRYLYFPMLGFAWLVGGYLSRLNDAFPRRLNPSAALLCFLLLPLLFLSFQRTRVWHNSVTLWSDTSQKFPTLKDPLANLGEAYSASGQPRKALETYEKLFALKREFSDEGTEEKTLNDAASIYLNSGAPEKALPLLTGLTTKFPDFVPGLLTLGRYYAQVRNPLQAEKEYRAALSLDPHAAQPYILLGNLSLETGRVADARDYYAKCLENGGDGPDLQYNLSCVESLAGNQEKSLQHLEAALKFGYRNREAITGNPELSSLRNLPAFSQLLAGYFPNRR